VTLKTIQARQALLRRAQGNNWQPEADQRKLRQMTQANKPRKAK